MRVLYLFILFSAVIYKFYPHTQDGPLADTVRVNMSAVRRQLADVPSVNNRSPAIVKKRHFEPQSEELAVKAKSKKSRPEVHDEEAELGTVASWNAELKELLVNLEPEDGEEMYNKYVALREVYRTEFNNLANTRANLYADENGKPDKKLYRQNKEAIEEHDYFIDQLEIKHEEGLKDALGAHYEQVKEMQEQYHDAISNEDSEESKDHN